MGPPHQYHEPMRRGGRGYNGPPPHQRASHAYPPQGGPWMPPGPHGLPGAEWPGWDPQMGPAFGPPLIPPHYPGGPGPPVMVPPGVPLPHPMAPMPQVVMPGGPPPPWVPAPHPGHAIPGPRPPSMPPPDASHHRAAPPRSPREELHTEGLPPGVSPPFAGPGPPGVDVPPAPPSPDPPLPPEEPPPPPMTSEALSPAHLHPSASTTPSKAPGSASKGYVLPGEGQPLFGRSLLVW
jgi:CASK-interacting protein